MQENYVLRFKDGRYRYIGRCYREDGWFRIPFSLCYEHKGNLRKMKLFTKKEALEIAKSTDPLSNFWLVDRGYLECCDVLEAININRIEKE